MPRKKMETVTIQGVRLYGMSAKAHCYNIDGVHEWIPKKCIPWENRYDVIDNEYTSVVLYKWFAEIKGFLNPEWQIKHNEYLKTRCKRCGVKLRTIADPYCSKRRPEEHEYCDDCRDKMYCNHTDGNGHYLGYAEDRCPICGTKLYMDKDMEEGEEIEGELGK